VYIVHRLDKFVSGLLVFAKSERVQAALRRLFEAHDIDRRYWAIVEGRVHGDSGTIRSHLAEDRSLRMRSTTDTSQGKHAVTHYRVLRRFPRLTALEITLETGRKNQIRAHLSELGHPVAGDRAYGSTVDPLGRMGLHAFRLGFEHPIRKVQLRFETEAPPEFRRYLLPE
jgi:RluA family pseudouridine synthase